MTTTLDAPAPSAQTGSTSPGSADASPAGPLDATARASLERACEALFSKQNEDGHWCAELEGDSILNSEYLLMKVILGQHEAPEATGRDRELFAKSCNYMRMLQRDDGTWGQFPGSPPDISAMVKAYFALKIFGDDPDAPHMRRARERIHELGGAEKINTFSMFYLACLGQVSWDACPAIPPEIVLLPRWSPFHLDKVAAWTRTMILPLALCSALRPVRRLPSVMGIGELFIDQGARERLCKSLDTDHPYGWTNLFIHADRAMKAIDKLGLTGVMRGKAIHEAERWLLERMDPETTDGLGAIFPPMVYIQIAFQAMGYERDHPVIREAERQLDRFFVEEEDHLRIQPCFSPVWDTGIALYALTEAGLTAGNDERLERTCSWLLEREVTRVGDWVRNLDAKDRSMRMGPAGGPGAGGAWAFEYRNEWYPDVDDTAMVAKAMKRAAPDSARIADACARARRWISAMQNEDGGWAAFDKTSHREWMEHVPFADHNAMQDPSCADITGRTIESLVTCGMDPSDDVIRRAVAYLRREQHDDGGWFGRWGVNYLYGSWQAVGGLHAAGEDPRQPYLRRTVEWLTGVQNDDGGFGESANSYLESHPIGVGPSTASQTAWGVTTLMFLLPPTDARVRRAIAWLCEHQLDAPIEASAPEQLCPEPAGAWAEPWFTGTGFPKVFYLRYHLYRHYFPVMALARYLQLRGGPGATLAS